MTHHSSNSQPASSDGAVVEENVTLIIIITCVATIGGFLFGFDSGVINGTVDGLQTAFNSNSAGTGFNVASMLLGCAVGAFFAGRLADVFGRKTILIVSSLFFILRAGGSGIAQGSLEFIVYRILGGLAVGAASVMSPAYISEIAPAKYRGRLASIQQIAIISGLFIAFLSNFVLADMAGSSLGALAWGFEAWRWMFWVELLPALLFFICLLFIPESPRFLMLAGKPKQAKLIAARLYGASHADVIIDEISQSLVSKQHEPSLKDLLDKQGRVLKPIVWVGIGLAMFQQLVGINVVFYYGAVLWQSVGFSESDALLINVISGGLSIAACIVALVLIDTLGRKPLLFTGSVVMAVSLAVVAFAFTSGSVSADGQLQLSGTVGTIALIAANIYVVAFNFSWGPVMWVMLAEMFPNQMRGSSLAVAGLCQWVANFAITISFPVLLTTVGLAAAYGMYAFFACVSAIFVFCCVKETKGKALEQM